jgi:hypothetical protein
VPGLSWATKNEYQWQSGGMRPHILEQWALHGAECLDSYPILPMENEPPGVVWIEN